MKTRKLQNSKFIRQETTQPYTHRIANTMQKIKEKASSPWARLARYWSQRRGIAQAYEHEP